ncbi:hypothetical protein BH23PSE1_BH23PSE1_10640 [soil metagenome]
MAAAEDETPQPEPPEGSARRRADAAARARAYLDLWERNLADLALNGPAAPAPDASRRP